LLVFDPDPLDDGPPPKELISILLGAAEAELSSEDPRISCWKVPAMSKSRRRVTLAILML